MTEPDPTLPAEPARRAYYLDLCIDVCAHPGDALALACAMERFVWEGRPGDGRFDPSHGFVSRDEAIAEALPAPEAAHGGQGTPPEGAPPKRRRGGPRRRKSPTCADSQSVEAEPPAKKPRRVPEPTGPDAAELALLDAVTAIGEKATNDELAARCGVSKSTVNKGLAQLERDGRLRRQGERRARRLIVATRAERDSAAARHPRADDRGRAVKGLME